ncbi:MAG TPA: fibronectin type III domain-containing protein, partial [Candidatus Acidoferrales bacterium]|nr:fibronectin type III domain-containing protein [Candidatus Acidoferrales bacterium]
MIVLIAVIAGLERATAATVSLAWNPSTSYNVSGYKIYYGTISQDYTTNIVAGDVTNATINGLVAGTTYYFAATCYDALGDESGFSQEISWTIPFQPPTLNPIPNLTIRENCGCQTIQLSGITAGTNNGSQTLTVTAISSNGALLQPSVAYTSPNSSGTLSFKPALDACGVATITVTVNNGGTTNNLVSSSFTVTVVPLALPAIPVQPIGLGACQDIAVDSAVSLTAQPLNAGRQISLAVTGGSGALCVVQASTDLVHWTPLQTNASPFTLVDANARAFPARFYRVVPGSETGTGSPTATGAN